MNQLLSWMSNIHGGVLSLILVFLVIIDTSLSLKIRIPKGIFLSKRMLAGAGYSLTLASIPVLCDIIIKNNWVNSVDILTLRTVMIVVFLSVGLGVLGSCIANYAVAYPEAKMAYAFAEKLLPKELEEKLERIESEKNEDALNTGSDENKQSTEPQKVADENKQSTEPQKGADEKDGHTTE